MDNTALPAPAEPPSPYGRPASRRASFPLLLMALLALFMSLAIIHLVYYPGG